MALIAIPPPVPKEHAMKKLKEARGDFTLNGTFIILLVFMLLVLAISVLGVANDP